MARHASLSEQLKALMAYRNRPEGEPEPTKSNWTTTVANDNADPEEVEDYSFERNLLVTPSVQEIKKQVDTGDIERGPASEMEIVRDGVNATTVRVPGKITRIGKLRFSDGTQTEKAYTAGPDGDVVQMDARMPVGAMLGTTEKAKQQAGGKGYTQAQLVDSNGYFAKVFGVEHPHYKPRTKRRNGPSLTADESRAELARAIANTKQMPPVKKCAPSLPCGAPRVADSFLGMQKGKKGESGAIAWEDIATHKVNREIWDETLAYLSKRDIATLDTALTAKSMREIGEAHGFHGKRAERMGKKILRAANDNLTDAYRNAAA